MPGRSLPGPVPECGPTTSSSPALSPAPHSSPFLNASIKVALSSGVEYWLTIILTLKVPPIWVLVPARRGVNGFDLASCRQRRSNSEHRHEDGATGGSDKLQFCVHVRLHVGCYLEFLF